MAGAEGLAARNGDRTRDKDAAACDVHGCGAWPRAAAMRVPPTHPARSLPRTVHGSGRLPAAAGGQDELSRVIPTLTRAARWDRPGAPSRFYMRHGGRREGRPDGPSRSTDRTTRQELLRLPGMAGSVSEAPAASCGTGGPAELAGAGAGFADLRRSLRRAAAERCAAADFGQRPPLRPEQRKSALSRWWRGVVSGGGE